MDKVARGDKRSGEKGKRRTNTAGQIIPRNDDTWLVRVFMGRDGKGKRHYLNKTIKVSERLGHSTIVLTLDTYSQFCRRCRKRQQVGWRKCYTPVGLKLQIIQASAEAPNDR